MTIETDILDALMTQLTSPALDSPATPVASPLVNYTPTSGTTYMKAHAPMRVDPEDVGLHAPKQVHRGIFQVDAVMPDNGSGEAPGLRLAALVRDRFAFGTSIAAGSCRLQILQTPTIATAVKDAPWLRFPVSIRYIVI